MWDKQRESEPAIDLGFNTSDLKGSDLAIELVFNIIDPTEITWRLSRRTT
jgi:hypothetical protein